MSILKTKSHQITTDVVFDYLSNPNLVNTLNEFY